MGGGSAQIDRVGKVRKAEMPHPKREYRYIAGQSIHRRLEDVTYWRKKAGWFDDDASMKNYNSKAQSNRFFSSDDGSGGGNNGSGYSSETLLWNIIGVIVIVVSVAFMFFIARAITRKLTAKSRSKESIIGERDAEKTSSARSHRSRTSRARSRSRSRAANDESGATTEYRLMDGEDDHRRERRKERSSSRVRSSSRRSQSRTRSSSSRRASSKETSGADNMLV